MAALDDLEAKDYFDANMSDAEADRQLAGDRLKAGLPANPAAKVAKPDMSKAANRDPLGGNKPLGDPAKFRNIGGNTPLGPSQAGDPPGTMRDAQGRLMWQNGKLVAPREEWNTGDGKIVRTRYGASVKAVQPDGSVRWEDNEGNPIEAPKSWNEAMTQQNAEKLESAKKLSQQKYEFMRKSIDERRRMRAERDFTTAEAAKNALRLLDEGEGEIKTHKATGKKYRVVKVGGDAIARAGEQTNAMGRRLSLQKIAAYIQVDDDGRPVEGAQPSFYIAVGKNNGDGAKDTKTLKPLDFGTVQKQFARSFATLNGVSEGEAQNYAVSEFGQRNPFGWKIGGEKPASVQAAEVRAQGAKEVQSLKNQGALEVAAVKPSGKGGKSEEELALERERLDIRRKELEARVKRGEDSQQLREDIFAYNLAKDGYGELSNIFSKATPEQKQAFINDYFSSLDALKNKYGGGKAPADGGAAKPGEGAQGADDAAESKDYPGYTNGKAKRAIAAGWKWDPAAKKFVKPKEEAK